MMYNAWMQRLTVKRVFFFAQNGVCTNHLLIPISLLHDIEEIIQIGQRECIQTISHITRPIIHTATD